MGWKLAGIVIDKNFEKDLAGLFDLLNITEFELEKDSTFEDEVFEILETDILSIGFFGNGTFFSTGVELMTNERLLRNASTHYKIVAFYVNETTSTYCFDYFSKGEYLRKKWISYSDKNIDSSENFGEMLSVEKDEDDDLNIIFKLISSLLGKDFYEIEESEQMFRFVKIKPEKMDSSKKQAKRFWKRLFK